MWQYNQNELYHYGVMGMKWGRHRAYRTANRYDRRSQEYKENANRAISSNSKKAFNDGAKIYKNLANGERALGSKYNTKSGKRTTKFYAKEQERLGEPTSYKDSVNGKSGTKFYNEMTRKNGKDFADAVLAQSHRNMKKQAITNGAIAVAGAGFMGLSVYQALSR